MNDNFRKAIDSMNTFNIQMSSLIEKLKPALRKFEQNLKPMEEKLIKAGWTINMNMMPYHIIEIGELIEADEIDKYFYDYYMLNNQVEFKVLKNMCKHYLDKNLAKAYDESLFAFDNNKYIICANTLVPIIEGALSSFDEEKGNFHMIKICKDYIDRCPSDETSINRILWNTNLKFIEQLYSSYKFSESEPPFLNRHWLMHGRSSFEIKEIDCLRLLNAIGTLCSIKKGLYRSKKNNNL